MIRLEVKKLFFNRPAVIDLVGKKTAAALSKAGAYVRKRAQRSMGKRKRASLPGQPPSSHKGFLKQLILFSLDPQTRSVVIGPTPYRGPAEVPGILEHGGAGRRVRNSRRIKRLVGKSGEIRLGGRPCGNSKVSKGGPHSPMGSVLVTYARLRTAAQAARANDLNEQLYGPATVPAPRIAARPYMGPALVAEAPNFPGLWAA